MFVRTAILSLLLLVLFQQIHAPQSQGELAAQRATNENRIGAQQDPSGASCKRELAALQRNYENLKAEFNRVNRELEALHRQGSSGGGASGELTAARREIAGLKERLASAEGALRNLREQTAPLRTENARLTVENRRLTGESGELQNSKRELETKLRTAENSLSELRQQSTSVQIERDALAARVSACTEQLEKNPSVLLEAAIAAQTTSGTGGGTSSSSRGDTAIRIDGTQGRTHIIRDLVIGTLDISFDSDEVRANHSFPLKAVFKPHPVLQPGSLPGADARNISWHIEMQYAPQHLTATYDRQQSGNKDARRTVDATEEQTWVWQLQTAKDFESDVSDLILFAGYEMQGDSKTRDLLREPIKLAVPPGPGFFAVFKENLNWILGLIATILGICTGYLGLKQKRQNAAPGGQPQPAPKT